MRKSTLFISATLTVFMMATMFGVASAYQQVVNHQPGVFSNTGSQTASQPISGVLPVISAVQAPTAVPQTVTPDEATLIAVDYLGNSEVYSVEVVDYEGAPTFLVTFSSGDLVYVSSTGMVVANTKIQPVVVVAAAKGNGGGNSNNENNSSNSGGSSNSSNGEHEEHEEHDDD